jgi:DNA invertase Pin-like site-specific DNA recombinase
VSDLLTIVARLEANKVCLRVLSMSGSQALDTSTSTGRLMLSVIGAIGQAEREGMLERQREGIAKAKREGRYRGRVPTARRQSARDHQAQGGRRQALGYRRQLASTACWQDRWLAIGWPRDGQMTTPEMDCPSESGGGHYKCRQIG